MANSGFLGISLLAYASWQTLHFLNDRGSRVWAKQKYHRYIPRPTAETLRKGKSCANCTSYSCHPDFLRSGLCTHPDWQAVLRASEVMVRKDACCELWERAVIPR